MKQKAGNEDDNNSQQSENQRVRKPALTPVGERETEANQTLLLSCQLFLSCLSLFLCRVHAIPSIGSCLCPTL